MTIDEKAAKSLGHLGVSDTAGVQALVAEIVKAMNAERQMLTNPAPDDPAQWERAAKDLRDRWLARKNGILSQIDANWLKSAPKDLKPSVGREFNRLREVV